MAPDLQGEGSPSRENPFVKQTKDNVVSASNRNMHKEMSQPNDANSFRSQESLEELEETCLIFSRKGTTPNKNSLPGLACNDGVCIDASKPLKPRP